MGRNDIKLDQINARLGDMRQSRSYDETDSDQADEAPTLSAGFLATVVGLFLAVSSATYMFAAGYNPLSTVSLKTEWGDGGASYFSPVDLICGKAWVKGGRNDAAIMCYLTTRTERLCDDREKNHLARLVKSYRADASAFEASKGGGAAVAIIASDDGIGDVLESAPSSLASDTKQLPREALVAAIRKVGAIGYMAKSDYGWMVDSLVSDAYKDQLQPPSPCKTQ